MLDKSRGECMISINNINNGVKEPTCLYQNCHTNQILIVSGYVKVRESLYTRVIIGVNTILNHIDTRVFYLGMKNPHSIENKNIVKYPYPYPSKSTKSSL